MLCALTLLLSSNLILCGCIAANIKESNGSIRDHSGGRYYLILNAIGTIDSSRALAILRAVDFIERLENQSHLMIFRFKVILWMYPDGYSYLPAFAKRQLKAMDNLSTRYYSNDSLEDYNVGRNKKEIECVTAILESLLSEKFPQDSKAILVSISHDVKLNPLNNFQNLFKHIGRGGLSSSGHPTSGKYFHVKLMGKTRRMTSVSDWHDLMVAVLLIGDPAVKEWLLRVRNIYYRHAAGRLAATLFDPRPALLEATLQLRKTVRVGYFRSGEICMRILGSDSSRCKEKSLLEVECVSHDDSVNGVCAELLESQAWKMSMDPDLQEFPFPTDLTQIHQSSYDAPVRFLIGAKDLRPAPFCWQYK